MSKHAVLPLMDSQVRSSLLVFVWIPALEDVRNAISRIDERKEEKRKRLSP